MFNCDVEVIPNGCIIFYLFRLDSEVSDLVNGATQQAKGERLVYAHSYVAMHFFHSQVQRQ